MEKRVFLAKCPDYEIDNVTNAVTRILNEFGGVSGILGKGKKVLVKPNLLVPRKPEAAATTHPSIMEAICEQFVKAGAEVTIIDSTGGPHTKFLLKLLYSKTGMKQMAENCGAVLSYNTKSKKVTFPEGRTLKESEILVPILEADVVISVAKAKTHAFQAMTGCVKNLYGTIPGTGKPLNHRKFPKREDFASMLIDICEFVRPSLSILDGVYGMEGEGPSGGEPKFLGVIAGGISPYAVDLAQCHLMGLNTNSIYTIKEAASRGLAPSDPTKLTWLGDEPDNFKTSFIPAGNNNIERIPVITEKCTGCGDCARICPIKCIKIKNRTAVINDKKCIKCYCCHEFCPAKAVRVEND